MIIFCPKMRELRRFAAKMKPVDALHVGKREQIKCAADNVEKDMEEAIPVIITIFVIFFPAILILLDGHLKGMFVWIVFSSVVLFITFSESVNEQDDKRSGRDKTKHDFSESKSRFPLYMREVIWLVKNLGRPYFGSEMEIKGTRNGDIQPIPDNFMEKELKNKDEKKVIENFSLDAKLLFFISVFHITVLLLFGFSHCQYVRLTYQNQTGINHIYTKKDYKPLSTRAPDYYNFVIVKYDLRGILLSESFYNWFGDKKSLIYQNGKASQTGGWRFSNLILCSLPLFGFLLLIISDRFSETKKLRYWGINLFTSIFITYPTKGVLFIFLIM